MDECLEDSKQNIGYQRSFSRPRKRWKNFAL